ncbi:MAG: YggS family pyridoxal phosphate-dependent enzyme [Myxococcota bacterium]|nr:YggS family pyridoxal phosphate-dependent enzyme [Myxococcota bacterium]MDP6241983.1 YggS family pyridoxal phosphate-dependent enzyme [Myxococcota bacterium]MDP7072967.1 YggS family pyridoxal phosphate-dependent enzyme [Myxococcota bacterium]MDP7297761.1 YggS family pyridoxal phosphate-dependent enzyme [Myxococcota bacterium]MDP7431374.1 YggS family pyridoxal phosphate-dependent enzyme [Myxococcota bacterium]
MSNEIADRLAAVRERMARAATRAGRRPEDVRLVGVTKRKTAADLVAAVGAGLGHVGENYVQEAHEKLSEARAALEGLGLKTPAIHFIGTLQRNKAGVAARLFDVVESVDRIALGDVLDRRAGAAGRRLEVLLQVNVSSEARKGGVAPEDLPALAAHARSWRHLAVTGLMTIPTAATDPEQQRPAFAKLRALRDSLRAEAGGQGLDHLSMGMSGDFEVAIEEGATIVRVGTAIFGSREAGPRQPASR